MSVPSEKDDNFHCELTAKKYIENLEKKRICLVCHVGDVNECEVGPDPCHHLASCHNTDGSFICSCHAGYDGDGVKCAGDCLIRFAF